PSTPSFRMPGGPALTRPTLSFHSVVSYAGWPCAYPAYTFLPVGRFVCRMAMRLPGLHFPSTPSFRMPDGDALTRIHFLSNQSFRRPGKR
ncbi:hypothetical protein ACVGX5_17970, partial [Enterobacter intestinihominis]